MRRVLVPILLPVLALVAGCSNSRDTAATAATGLGTMGDEGTDSGDTDSGADTGQLFDVGDGMGEAGDNEGDMGCRGIDFLFVVDNSGSMKTSQEALTASFPGFVTAIEEKVQEFEAADFHILVADTDAIKMNSPGAYCGLSCPEGCQADNGAEVPCEFYEDPQCMNTCQADMDGSCLGSTCKDLLECGECNCNRGAGIVEDNQGNPCGVVGGERYLQKDQPNLSETFACLAEVGTEGDGDEHQAQGVITALEANATGPGGCNEGFIRDDAILVITLITDEEDALHGVGSPDDPPEWYEQVIASKNDDPDAIVMLGLINDGHLPNPVCEAEEAVAPRLGEFVTAFPRNVLGSVCEPNYTAFFEEAVDIVKTTCESYVPPQG